LRYSRRRSYQSDGNDQRDRSPHKFPLLNPAAHLWVKRSRDGRCSVIEN
jgi:hypothetical protein